MYNSLIFLQDHASGADFLTCAAVGAFFIINMSTEICYGNSAVRTGFLTFFTADTSHLTGRSNSFSFIMRTAAHKGGLGIGNQLDQMIRTFGNTFAAGLALLLICHSHTVDNVDGIKGTGLYAASESHTAIGTAFCTAARDKGHHLTVLNTGVYKIAFCFSQVPVHFTNAV